MVDPEHFVDDECDAELWLGRALWGFQLVLEITTTDFEQPVPICSLYCC